MKLIMLGFSKQKSYEDKCIVEFTTQFKPMIISSEMKYKPELLIKNKVYDADVTLSSFCWWSNRNDNQHSTHIRNSCLPYSFISSKIEKIVDINLNTKHPYVKYKTTLADQAFDMVLHYPERDEDDEPIKDVFEIGDTIVGLFKAKVKIKKIT